MNKRTAQAPDSDASVPLKKRFRNIETESKSNEDINDNELQSPLSPPPESEQKFGKDKAWQMMGKMGYKAGEGLGAQGQGRSEPIDVQMRHRRRGLGAEIKGFELSMSVTWDEDQEQISVEEEPRWIPECALDVPTAEDLEGWIKIGSKRSVIDEETHFCDPDILAAMIKSKSVFDELNDRDLRAARGRANPFETVKGAIFQNRAAMKMANLDAVFDDLFTNPKLNGKVWVPKDGNELFYFADICAGPGGFTEYVLWRRGWSAHGFGLTLRGKDDFRLDEFLSASPEMFEPFYGKNGIDGDGDITNPENLEAFKNFVWKATGGQGLHMVMADGGFSVEGKENIQEILSKRLYLCQSLCAINVLQPNGSFVCKLFDVFTPFSVGLIYLLYRSFDSVCLHKPHTSRPANSERYVICKGLRDDVDAVRAHLTKCNLAYDTLVKEGRDKTEDVDELVPLDVLQNDEAFVSYIKESNEMLAKRQTLYLHKYKAYAQNTMLQDSRQDDLRTRCLRYWKVPDEKRPPPPKPSPSQKMEELCGNYHNWITNVPTGLFDPDALDTASEQEYRVLLRTAKPTIFIALGKQHIFHHEGTRWDKAFDYKLSIPRDTVFYAEYTHEYRGEGKGQMPSPVLRVFDAYCLGGENISEKAFRERRRLLTKFCSAIRKLSRPDITPVLVADAWHVEQMPSLRNNFVMGKIKGGLKPMYRYPEVEAQAANGVRGGFDLQAQGFIIYRVIREEWKICHTRTDNRPYFFNIKNGKSVFEATEEAFNGFVAMQISRKIWPDPKQRYRESSDDNGRMQTPEEQFMSDLLRIGDAAQKRRKEGMSSRSDSR